MNDSERPQNSVSDAWATEDIVTLMKSVEPHDYERVEPPAEMWTGLLIRLRDEDFQTAEQTDGSRRQPFGNRFQPLHLAAALLLVVAVVGLVGLLVRPQSDGLSVTASALMTDDGLEVATTADAQASVLCEGQRCWLDVDLSAVPPAPNAELELWIINADVSDMHSLGTISGDGLFALPDGVSVDDFPVVDISVEPFDGDETHSGQSVLRGVLETSS